ncbi:hypothetical protein LZZ85_05735 [Terrimonas sp. NA20]|uniref:Uncharacterized protein n=1 Tax=Terrimonas ginsenosidimutans TaxID=2908004 RepID=A0ABS9KN93_9BACT|nr:hypothetical protein [Terrimonas ginsenosidimutans]MCG2613769.1 hypothetical protein [Terrimonas ginsenosidimutans]
MKIAVFIITLCMFLIGGADRACAGYRSKGCCYTRTYHHEIDAKRNDLASVLKANQPTIDIDTELLIADELEEECNDANNRRSKFAWYHSFIADDNADNSGLTIIGTAPSYWPKQSDKYIHQRVFKI